VQRLHLDAIAAARKAIYIENQYLTSKIIGDALCRVLTRADGPEVVMVLPRYTGDWLEQNTMDALRRYLLDRLRRSDRYGSLRLSAVCPRPRLGDAARTVDRRLALPQPHRARRLRPPAAGRHLVAWVRPLPLA